MHHCHWWDSFWLCLVSSMAWGNIIPTWFIPVYGCQILCLTSRSKYNHQVGIFLASGGKLENKVFKLLIGGSTAMLVVCRKIKFMNKHAHFRLQRWISEYSFRELPIDMHVSKVYNVPHIENVCVKVIFIWNDLYETITYTLDFFHGLVYTDNRS